MISVPLQVHLKVISWANWLFFRHKLSKFGLILASDFSFFSFSPFMGPFARRVVKE